MINDQAMSALEFAAESFCVSMKQIHLKSLKSDVEQLMQTNEHTLALFVGHYQMMATKFCAVIDDLVPPNQYGVERKFSSGQRVTLEVGEARESFKGEFLASLYVLELLQNPV